MKKTISMVLLATIMAFNTSCSDDSEEFSAPTSVMQTRAREQRVQSLIQQARTGDSEAYKALALCYHHGDGVEKSWLNTAFCYYIYCEKTGKDIKRITEWLDEKHPYRLINEIMPKPALDKASREKLALLEEVAPAEAKAIKAIKIRKKISEITTSSNIATALREAEQEGSEMAAVLLAICYTDRKGSCVEEAEILRMAQKYPCLYLVIGDKRDDNHTDGSTEDALRVMEYYSKADAHGMLTPQHAGKLRVIRHRLEKQGVIAPDELEMRRLGDIMKIETN